MEGGPTSKCIQLRASLTMCSTRGRSAKREATARGSQGAAEPTGQPGMPREMRPRPWAKSERHEAQPARRRSTSEHLCAQRHAWDDGSAAEGGEVGADEGGGR